MTRSQKSWSVTSVTQESNGGSCNAANILFRVFISHAVALWGENKPPLTKKSLNRGTGRPGGIVFQERGFDHYIGLQWLQSLVGILEVLLHLILHCGAHHLCAAKSEEVIFIGLALWALTLVLTSPGDSATGCRRRASMLCILRECHGVFWLLTLSFSRILCRCAMGIFPTTDSFYQLTEVYIIY